MSPATSETIFYKSLHVSGPRGLPENGATVREAGGAWEGPAVTGVQAGSAHAGTRGPVTLPMVRAGRVGGGQAL